MGKIYIIMGKSASGKDTLYRILSEDTQLNLKKVVGYTTRPIRAGEQEGREYHFVGLPAMRELSEAGKLIESRVYHTVYGDWYYFTADDGQIELTQGDYLMLGTLSTYSCIRDYFGKEAVVPLYIEVEDGERLKRAIAREEATGARQYEEMCRRFLADTKDFSEENLARAGIRERFRNRNAEQTAAMLKKEILNKRF